MVRFRIEARVTATSTLPCAHIGSTATHTKPSIEHFDFPIGTVAVFPLRIRSTLFTFVTLGTGNTAFVITPRLTHPTDIRPFAPILSVALTFSSGSLLALLLRPGVETASALVLFTAGTGTAGRMAGVGAVHCVWPSAVPISTHTVTNVRAVSRDKPSIQPAGNALACSAADAVKTAFVAGEG